jgi:hypothetical protein
MSLITRQLLGQTILEEEALVKLFQQGDRSQLMNNKIQHCRNLIKKYKKQLGEEQARLPPPPPQEPERESKNLPCQMCGHSFEFSVEDQDLFKRNGWTDPIRCEKCRAEHKANRIEAIALSCVDCGEDFDFTAKQQRIFDENGWDAPVRCPPCRAEHKANKPKPLTINCCDCKEDFIFTVKQQESYEEQGWDHPKRCKPCAQDKKSFYKEKKVAKTTPATNTNV